MPPIVTRFHFWECKTFIKGFIGFCRKFINNGQLKRIKAQSS